MQVTKSQEPTIKAKLDVARLTRTQMSMVAPRFLASTRTLPMSFATVRSERNTDYWESKSCNKFVTSLSNSSRIKTCCERTHDMSVVAPGYFEKSTHPTSDGEAVGNFMLATFPSVPNQ